MKVDIIVCPYGLAASIRKLVETAMLDSDKHDISFHLFLHSRIPEVQYECESLAYKYPIQYYPYGINRGLAKSWNEGMLEAHSRNVDVVIISNDDIYFSAGDIDKLAKKAVKCRKNYIISCAGFHELWNKPTHTHGYSCFAINPISLETIGCFDENLFPVYLEDIDHHRRATLAGLVEENCADTMIYHGGSSTLSKYPLLSLQNMVTQRKNAEYFVSKWLTEDIKNGFQLPFNNPSFSLRIDPETRHTPYGPPYDREDYYLVEQ